ncbi:dihydroorotase [Sphingobium sp. B12D2B]|uniref:dihydroorotase n=1 Tax=Sphingobium sp. B12D2B TaxID=2940577 RepID=UPI00222596B8|nr:dihydroorotase [Sphingobium sp. B12D2B]MCW2350779.1 dihydroorotase [Sphingobium sp. B12D2B]
MGLTAIINARLCDPTANTLSEGTLLVEDATIAAVGAVKVPDSAEVVDAKGMILAPGIIDLGVFRTDKPAFHFAGITRAALMPDQSPVLDEPGLIQHAARAGKPDFWVHPLGAATRGLEGRELAEMALMKSAGARAIATGRRWIADSGVMLRVLHYAAALDLVVITHAEDGGLTANAVATDGETASRLGLPSAPASAEAMAIARDIALAREAGARLHVRLVTTAAGFALIRAAKAEGLKVTCGTSPSYLFLNDAAVSDFRTFARLSPPLRDERDRLATIEAVADGTVDVLCSGHDPRGPEDKRLPFADALPGIAGAETLLPLALNLVRESKITETRMMALLAANPAALLGLDAGRLAPGAPADLILIAPDTPWIVDSAKMAAAAGNTPFDKLPVQGRARMIMKGGVIR